MKKTVVCFTAWMAALVFTLPVIGQTQDAGERAEQTPAVIFVCEHGAAKSVLSAAIFNKLARERRMNLRAIARGTNPDPEISQKVAAGLQADGLVASEPAPKKISKADLDGVRRVWQRRHLPANNHLFGRNGADHHLSVQQTSELWRLDQPYEHRLRHCHGQLPGTDSHYLHRCARSN